MKTNNFSSMLIAVILALFVAGLVYFVQSRSAAKMQTTQPENTKKVLVSKLDLTPGERITFDKFKWVDWPEKSIQDGYYVDDEEKELKELDQKVVRYEVLRGEPLKESDLVGGDKKSVLAAFIKEGMKAVSVPMKRVANASIYVVPGDYVDIILPQRKGRDQSVDTILSGIKVIAVDNNFYVPKGETAKTIPKNITLEVTSEQAEALALSIASGRIVISYQSAYTAKSDSAKPGIKKLAEAPKKKEPITITRGTFGR